MKNWLFVFLWKVIDPNYLIKYQLKPFKCRRFNSECQLASIRYSQIVGTLSQLTCQISLYGITRKKHRFGVYDKMKLLITYAVGASYGIAHYADTKAPPRGVSFKLSALGLNSHFGFFENGLCFSRKVYTEFAGRHKDSFGN